MHKFEEYFLMDEENIIEYARGKYSLFSNNSELEAKEIGDGNLNYIFRVMDKNSEESVIVKQSSEVARISDEMIVSTDRVKIESGILQLQGEFVPGLVPEVYLYDDIMKAILMEDLSDYTVMREAMLSYNIYPKFSEDITTYMVNTLLPTTDIIMNHKKKKELVRNFINPDLCEISEDLVYTEPFNDYNNRNILFDKNEKWIKKNIYNDSTLKLEVAKLKFDFMTNTQALIHGDLHTGSVFVTPQSTKVFDPEFAFYGPMGYDIGNVIANLIFAYMNGYVNKENKFISWLETTIIEVLDKFKEKFNIYWDENDTEIMAKESGFKEWYLDNILQDTAGIAGLELTRRIIGLAKVEDITSISNPQHRIFAERVVLSQAKKLIISRDSFKEGKDYINILKNTINDYRNILEN